MLDKIEFSDIYKFISSIGLALILAAMLIPFFIFQLDLIKNYKDIDIAKLSPLVRESIEYQNKVLNYAFKFWWIISGLLLVVGIVIFIIGISKWKKRQEILDRSQDLDLLEKEKLIQDAPNSDINQKNEEDAEEINETNQNKISFIRKYKSIEMKVVESIRTNNPNIRINHNAKVGNFIYDIIIIKRISPIERIHKICEIKYYQKEIFYSYVQHGISSFLLAISNYKNNIVNDDRRIRLEFYMIWICSNNEQITRLNSYIEKAMNYSKDKGVNLKIIIKIDSNIDSLKDELL